MLEERSQAAQVQRAEASSRPCGQPLWDGPGRGGGGRFLFYSIPFFCLPAPFSFPGPGRVEQLDRLRGRWIPALPPVPTCCVTLGGSFAFSGP